MEDNMRFEEYVRSLREDIREAEADESKMTVQGTYMLPGGRILCTQRAYGDSRFPCETDGMAVWAHTTGYIDACESTFNVFRTADYNEDATVLFFAGEEREGGGYDPISITGADCATYELEGLKRYVVFGSRHAIYLVETAAAIYAVRVHVDGAKRIHFTYCAINGSNEPHNFYAASYFEPYLRYMPAEGFFNRMTKYVFRLPDGAALFKTLNAEYDHLTLTRRVSGEPFAEYATVGKRGVLGIRGRNLANAEAWKSGCFSEEKTAANTTDLPAAADILHFTLPAGGSVRIDWQLRVIHGPAVEDELRLLPDPGAIDDELAASESAQEAALDGLRITFDDYRSSIIEGEVFKPLDAQTFNRFIRSVQRQVSLCALGKNYAGSLLGVRDVYQQLESALLWEPLRSRAQIVRTLDQVLSTGRAPRQISFPDREGEVPEMDLRPYVDQGLWIISTVYTYLSWTGDFTLLDEECGYYDAAATYGPLTRSEERTTVYEHLCRICDFLCSNIDPDTSCLRALYGDWNDALDGLGRTEKEGEEFGSGVSVMASLQLYQALGEIAEIAERHDGVRGAGKSARYTEIKESLAAGLREHAFTDGRVIHGWGDDGAYKVGSTRDYDGADRISITPNAFWIISGMAMRYPETCAGAAQAIKSLDSKYGLLTFSRPLWPFDCRVGRISTITPGTYENRACYVHAALFGGMALFGAGESAEAWRQMEKALTVTHKNATLTTFVMPNSYCDAPDFGADGDSMGDWYTGSGTVLIKELVRLGFGVWPSLDALMLCPPAFMPCGKAELEFTLRGKRVRLVYRDEGAGARTISLDGAAQPLLPHPTMKNKVTFIKYDDLRDGALIEITD